MVGFFLLVHFSTLFFRLPLIFILDAVLGEVSFVVHPVILMGRLISFLEKKLRRIFGCAYEKSDSETKKTGFDSKNRKIRERFAGAFLVLIVVSVSFFIPFAAESIFLRLSLLSCEHSRTLGGYSLPLYVAFFFIFFVLDVFWGYQSVAARCLFDEATNVRKKLSVSVEEGRIAVSRIVGRDTKNLSGEGIVKACVESVAESTTDGIFSPIFFYAIGGAPLALFYKSVNTMDSMIAYKNPRYRYFGTVAARLDDVANFIPARLAALFMIFSALLFRIFGQKSFHPLFAARIFFRDRYKHASPNSAQTESTIAGILGIRLAGDAVYEGKVEKKEFLGDELKKVEPSDINSTLKIMYVSSVLFTIAISTFSFVI